MRIRSFLLAAAAAALAAPAAAQAPGVDLKLMPKLGAFAPLSELQEIATIEGELTRSLEPGLALGLAVELGLPALPGVRVNLDYASSTRLESEGGFGGGDPHDVRVIALVGDLVLRRDLLGPLAPYLLLGGGLKWYDFPDAAALTDGSDLTGHIGAGLELDLEFLGVFLEVSDYISVFGGDGAGEDESRLQNDIFAMVGVRVGIL